MVIWHRVITIDRDRQRDTYRHKTQTFITIHLYHCKFLGNNYIGFWALTGTNIKTEWKQNLSQTYFETGCGNEP